MSEQLELGFEGVFPLGVFASPSIWSDHWLEYESEAHAKDSAFPIATIEWRDLGPESLGYLRKIECGVILWGAQWWNRKKKCGGGFSPFRKWGPERAAMSEQEAIKAAHDFIAERMRAGDSHG